MSDLDPKTMAVCGALAIGAFFIYSKITASEPVEAPATIIREQE
jgi:hypothetical protein